MRDAIPWPFDWQLYEAAGGNRRYSSVNRGGGSRLPCLKYRRSLSGSGHFYEKYYYEAFDSEKAWHF